MSYEWYVQVMELMNEKSNIYINNEKIYNAENKLSREEKIEFLDRMNDDKISYILNLADEFQNDKDNLAKNNRGEVSAASLKEWLEKNDNRKLVDTNKSSIGTINFLNYTKYSGRFIQDINLTPASDVYCDFIDSLFHRQLEICEQQEKKYFKEHDTYSILSRKVSDNIDKYHTTFGLDIWKRNDRLFFKDNNDYCERNLTLDELRTLNSLYRYLSVLS